jgi:hypothetical protein
MLVFCVVTPCELVGGYQSFEGTSCFHPQNWRWGQYFPPKRWYLPTNPYGVTTRARHPHLHCCEILRSNITAGFRNSQLSLIVILHSWWRWWGKREDKEENTLGVFPKIIYVFKRIMTLHVSFSFTYAGHFGSRHFQPAAEFDVGHWEVETRFTRSTVHEVIYLMHHSFW